jgi:hypothetical protein
MEKPKRCAASPRENKVRPKPNANQLYAINKVLEQLTGFHPDSLEYQEYRNARNKQRQPANTYDIARVLYDHKIRTINVTIVPDDGPIAFSEDEVALISKVWNMTEHSDILIQFEKYDVSKIVSAKTLLEFAKFVPGQGF